MIGAIGQEGIDKIIAQANARAAEIKRQSMLAPVSWLQQIGTADRIASQRIVSNAGGAVRATGGAAQPVPKKASGLSPIIIVGGVAILGAAVFLVMRARKKKA